VQAKLKTEGLINGNYIHCRSHLLNLAAANVTQSFKALQSLFSTLNSTWRFFHNSPKRHKTLVEMRKILNDPELELVSTGDTRWTSHYRGVKTGITVTFKFVGENYTTTHNFFIFLKIVGGN